MEAKEFPEGYGPDGRDVEETPVVFRVWTGKDGGDVVALFPTVPHCADKEYLCMSYMHVGQHGAANYHGVIDDTRPAKPEEYAALKAELEEPYPGFGYRLKVYQRGDHRMHQKRRDACRAYRDAAKAAAEKPKKPLRGAWYFD